MRLGMLINLNKCVSCYSCVAKCKQEHFLPKGVLWGRILISEIGAYPTVTKLAYPVLCNNCQEAKCVEVCPVKDCITGEPEKIHHIDPKKCKRINELL